MSDYPTCSLLIEAIDEETGGPLTSEGAALVLRGWEHGQKSMDAELTAARDEAERLRGRVSDLEALDAVLPDSWGRRPLEMTDEIVQAATKAVRESLGKTYVAVASHVLNAIWPLLEHPDGRP